MYERASERKAGDEQAHGAHAREQEGALPRARSHEHHCWHQQHSHHPHVQPTEQLPARHCSARLCGAVRGGPAVSMNDGVRRGPFREGGQLHSRWSTPSAPPAASHA